MIIQFTGKLKLVETNTLKGGLAKANELFNNAFHEAGKNKILINRYTFEVKEKTFDAKEKKEQITTRIIRIYGERPLEKANLSIEEATIGNYGTQNLKSLNEGDLNKKFIIRCHLVAIKEKVETEEKATYKSIVKEQPFFYWLDVYKGDYFVNLDVDYSITEASGKILSQEQFNKQSVEIIEFPRKDEKQTFTNKKATFNLMLNSKYSVIYPNMQELTDEEKKENSKAFSQIIKVVVFYTEFDNSKYPNFITTLQAGDSVAIRGNVEVKLPQKKVNGEWVVNPDGYSYFTLNVRHNLNGNYIEKITATANTTNNQIKSLGKASDFDDDEIPF